MAKISGKTTDKMKRYSFTGAVRREDRNWIITQVTLLLLDVIASASVAPLLSQRD